MMNRSLIHCSGYPSLLKEIKQPPEVIYSIGEVSSLNSIPTVAIVGARSCDRYGTEVAANLAYELSALGVCVVSGLAHGVDTAAHEGALKSCAKIPTVAVLAQGLQTDVYPRKNYPLVVRIVESGGIVLSHFPPTAPPLPQHFLERNRIIAGLCSVTIVVQASEKSGSLVTARFALEEGREVCAIPGEIGNPRSIGANKLIQQGATLVTSAKDVLMTSNALSHLVTDIERKKISSERIAEGALQILKILREESPLHIEVLGKRLGMGVTYQQDLLELEFLGAVTREPGNMISITLMGRKI